MRRSASAGVARLRRVPDLAAVLDEFLQPFVPSPTEPDRQTHTREYAQGLVSALASETGEGIADLHDQGRRDFESSSAGCPGVTAADRHRLLGGRAVGTAGCRCGRRSVPAASRLGRDSPNAARRRRTGGSATTTIWAGDGVTRIDGREVMAGRLAEVLGYPRARRPHGGCRGTSSPASALPAASPAATLLN